MPTPGAEPTPPVPQSGVRMVVNAFVLEGVVDRPDRGVELEDLQKRVEEIRLTRPRGFNISELVEVTDEITRVYRSAGYILARAYIPEQKVDDGRVVIRVIEGQLEQLTFQGNERYSEKILTRPFEDLINQPVNKDEVESALLALNEYPGIRFNSVFSPGDTVGTAKLGVNVESEKTTEGAVWFDNHGSEYTGEYRLWLDAAYNNPTGAADRLSAQVLTTFGGEGGKSDYYGLSYRRPVFGPNNLFSFDIGNNAFTVGGDFEELDLHGESSTMSASLRRNFLRSRDMNIEGRIALAAKSSSSEMSSLDRGKDKVTVATLGSVIDFRDGWSGYTQVGLHYSKGLPGVLGAMDEEGDDGASSRTGGSGEDAGGDFAKINFQAARWQPLFFHPVLKNQSLLARLEVQSSSDLLVSLEQMSLGGPNSVRAYPPSEFMVDKGQFISLEWIAKSVDEVTAGKFFEDLQFSAFYDYASGELNDPLANETSSPKLQGIGGSVQFSPQRKYLARLELAKPIGDPEPSNNRSIQYFFKLGYLF